MMGHLLTGRKPAAGVYGKPVRLTVEVALQGKAETGRVLARGQRAFEIEREGVRQSHEVKARGIDDSGASGDGPLRSRTGDWQPSLWERARQKWSDLVDRFVRGEAGRALTHELLPSSTTVMKALGMPDLPVRIGTHALDSLYNHGVTPSQLKRVPGELADPRMVMIWSWGKGDSSLNFVTGMKDAKGEPLVVAIRPNAGRVQGPHHWVATVTPMQPASMLRAVREGAALFVGDGEIAGVGAKDLSDALRFAKEKRGKEARELRQSFARSDSLPNLVQGVVYQKTLDTARGKADSIDGRAPADGGAKSLRMSMGDGADSSPLDKATMERAASTIKQAIKEAGAFVGKPLENLHTGLKATVSLTNLGKMTSGKAVAKSVSTEDHALAVANADKLFENAELDHSHPDKHGELTIAAIHRYVAPMVNAHGEVIPVKLTVKETTGPKQPNPIYSIEALETENPPSALSRGHPDDTGMPPQAGLNSSVQQTLDAMRQALAAQGDAKPLFMRAGNADPGYPDMRPAHPAADQPKARGELQAEVTGSLEPTKVEVFAREAKWTVKNLADQIVLKTGLTTDVIRRAATMMPSARRFHDLILHAEAKREAAGKAVTDAVYKFSRLERAAQGKVQAYLHETATGREWGYEPEHLGDGQKVQVSAAMAAKFDALGKAGQDVVRQIFRHGCHPPLKTLRCHEHRSVFLSRRGLRPGSSIRTGRAC
jgi:hypothetical protein